MPAPHERPLSGRSDTGDRIAVIDIGSNSIRVVVYDRLTRSPTAIFNEKILCGLGKTVERTGRLNPDGVRLAFDNLCRFRRLLDAMQVARVDVLATAAVRDAADGPDFVADVERRTGFGVRVISGEEEARLAAMGVLSGTPGADGLAGDLGGGSLELVVLENGVIGSQTTLPLGALRLLGLSDSRPANVAKVVDRHLEEIPWIAKAAGRTFYPVGGSWRALAKLHMEQVNHPVHIIHDYAVDGAELTDFVGLLGRQSRSSLERMGGIPKRRLETLPLAALVLERVLKAVRPARVVFSAYGLREGHLFDLLPSREREQDPLLTACAEVAERIGRFGHAEILTAWTARLFPEEGASMRRLRQAACLLSDLGWMEHPDYRAEHAFLRILRMPVAALDHSERAFLALAVYARYTGDLNSDLLAGAKTLAADGIKDRALILGLALRLAHTLTGGAATLLQRTALRLEEGSLTLSLPEDAAMLNGETVRRRMDALAKALGKKGEILARRAPGAVA